MTWVDAVLAGVLVVSGLLAFLRGFVREVLGIGAWVGAAVLAVWATPYARPRFEGWLHDRPALGEPIAYAVLFLVSLAVLLFISHRIARMVRGSALGGLDRTVGAGIRPRAGCGADHPRLYHWRVAGRAGGELAPAGPRRACAWTRLRGRGLAERAPPLALPAPCLRAAGRAADDGGCPVARRPARAGNRAASGTAVGENRHGVPRGPGE